MKTSCIFVLLLLLWRNFLFLFCEASDDWEQWDYYQLLGFNATTNRRQLDATDVKKAYKRQARRWHPDKHTSNSTKVTLENVNRRFAKIAEAYQVLSDTEQRQEYDEKLKFQQHKDDKPESSFWSNFAAQMDPRQLFQDLFDDDTDDDLYNFGFSKEEQEPVRVSQQEQVLRDTWGNQIIRIIQTSEFREGSRRRIQIAAQDFVEEWDSYRHMWIDRPVGEPFLVDEYYAQPPRFLTNSLTTGGSSLEVGRFRAKVQNCQFVLTEQVWGEEIVTWKRNDQPMQAYCQVKLRGSNLVLSVQDIYGDAILWKSPNPPIRRSSKFSARLDHDGVLAIYRLVPATNIDRHRQLLGIMKSGSLAQDLWQRMICLLLRLEENGLQRQCVWTSSRFGCLRIGRLAHQTARQVIHWGRLLVRIVDHLLEEDW